MGFEVNGKLLVKMETQQITDRFKKREFVLEVVDGMYAEQVKFQMTQDRCSILDEYRVDDEINVSFNLKGRAYNKNGETLYFTNLEAWKISRKTAGGNNNGPDEIPMPEEDFFGSDSSGSAGSSDDLPF